MRIHHGLFTFALTACAGAPTAVAIELSPTVISSLSAETTVHAIVVGETTPLADEAVRVSVAYTDRNGTDHAIEPVDGRTDARGQFAAVIGGLAFDGTGTVTVEAAPGVLGTATFAVLDRTPPVIEILPPTIDNRVGPGLPLDIQVRVTDEIGVSEVTIDGLGTIIGSRSTVVSSGALDTTLTFRTGIPAGVAAGPNVRVFALARDLSGNIAAAAPITLTVDPAITIATPPGLTGALLADGDAQRLVSPRALAVSAQDGHLYVADVARTGACNPSCIWRVDAATGAVDAAPVVVGSGDIEGVAVDATSDNLFYSDRSNRIGRLTWNGTAYVNDTTCNDVDAQRPKDPFHLVADAGLGVLVADDNNQQVVRVATCNAGAAGTSFSTNGNLNAPHGIALGPAGEIFVSDFDRDEVRRVDRTTGVMTAFQSGIDRPYGIDFLAGTTSPFAGSLMVAAFDARTIESTRGMGTQAAAFLRNTPIDVASAGATMYVLTAPSSGNRGRIYKVSGF
jgi:hypothetical protein